MIRFRKASPGDALLLTTLAREIYKEHYLHLWYPGGANWYMNEYAYALHKIEHELLDSNVEYYLALENDIPVGYMKLLLNASLPGYESNEALEVERIYLLKAITGKGTGRQLMRMAMEKAKALKKNIIFLKAMDSSAEAIQFYQKLGYSICGTLQLPLPAFSLMKVEYRGMLILKMGVL